MGSDERTRGEGQLQVPGQQNVGCTCGRKETETETSWLIDEGRACSTKPECGLQCAAEWTGRDA